MQSLISFDNRLKVVPFLSLQACNGDVAVNFPSKTASASSPSKRDDLIESVLLDSVIIDSVDVIPDMAVQPHTLQQEFALINVNIPNVIVEQVSVNPSEPLNGTIARAISD